MKKESFVFKSFKEGMKDFGLTISIIVNTLLLFIVYFIGIGITSCIAKVFNKHFFQTEISSDRKSYWDDLDLTKQNMESYYRQF